MKRVKKVLIIAALVNTFVSVSLAQTPHGAATIIGEFAKKTNGHLSLKFEKAYQTSNG